MSALAVDGRCPLAEVFDGKFTYSLKTSSKTSQGTNSLAPVVQRVDSVINRLNNRGLVSTFKQAPNFSFFANSEILHTRVSLKGNNSDLLCCRGLVVP